MACGCQGNQWTSDSDLVPAEIGQNAKGYFYTGVDEDGNANPPSEPLRGAAPKWNPDSGTED